MSKLIEVDFIDGVKEFIVTQYKTDLLYQGQNEFLLTELPDESSIQFSGDISLFRKQVYKEEDLILSGSWMIVKEGSESKIKIHKDTRTSSFTYTYVTYRGISPVKTHGLFSVDYIKGIIYFSSPVKNLELSYRSTIQYYEGKEMVQGNPSEYSQDQDLVVAPTSSKMYVYQIKDTSVDAYSREYLENPILNILTTEDNV